ncbi:HU family DNA-binding protein [Amorphus sp. 3PC139-8]|uniref:HU family DNA-binding protein n=1 Tax=Amorphus sp. 3PC139-8 TaxID=2735676 RepID=UPI00345CAB10
MNKSELVRVIAAETGVRPQDVDSVLTGFVTRVEEVVRGGGSVKVTGFGVFRARDTEPRAGRNPRTGEAIPIPASRRLAFKPSKKLTDRL